MSQKLNARTIFHEIENNEIEIMIKEPNRNFGLKKKIQ